MLRVTHTLVGLLVMGTLLFSGCGKKGRPVQPVDLPTLASQLTGTPVSTELDAYELLKDTPSHLDSASSDVVRNSMRKLIQDNEVYTWSLEDRNIRIPHYCRNECACIADRLGTALRASNPDILIFKVYMRGKRGGVVAYVGKNKKREFYMYHVVLVVGDAQGGWSFIDPKVIGDSRPHTFEEWYSRFDHSISMEYAVYAL